MTGGHPKGLQVLFYTEMWERFSYYGMRAILVLYMTRALGFDVARASNVYGNFTGLAYLMPLAGGTASFQPVWVEDVARAVVAAVQQAPAAKAADGFRAPHLSGGASRRGRGGRGQTPGAGRLALVRRR